MKKNKSDLNVNEKLVKMFEDQIPEDRQQVLRDIDSIMCNMFELQPNDLPWINPNNHDQITNFKPWECQICFQKNDFMKNLSFSRDVILRKLL